MDYQILPTLTSEIFFFKTIFIQFKFYILIPTKTKP